MFDLFVSLHATDEQLDFPVVYASAKEGYAKIDLKDEEHDTWSRSLTRSSSTFPPPRAHAGEEFKMLVANLDYSDYLGPHRLWEDLQRQGQSGRRGGLPARGRAENGRQNHGASFILRD